MAKAPAPAKQPQRVIHAPPPPPQEQVDEAATVNSGPVQIQLDEEFTYNGAHYGPGLVEAPDQKTADDLLAAQERLNNSRVRTPVVTVHGVISGAHPNTVAPGVLVPADVENRANYAAEQAQRVEQKASEARRAAAEAGATPEEQEAAAEQARNQASEEARAGVGGEGEEEGEGESDGAVALREGLPHTEASRSPPPAAPPPPRRKAFRPQPAQPQE